MKTCRRCALLKPSEDFPREKRVKDGLSSWCRQCYREYGSRWSRAQRRAQPAKVRRTDRDQHFRGKYGLRATDVERIVLSQEGRCLTCGIEFTKGAVPCVDHCHRTGVVRGILCRSCNVILGIAKEDPVRLRALARYVDPFALGNRVASTPRDEAPIVHGLPAVAS